MKKYLYIIAIMSYSCLGLAQIQEGEIAPNFSVVDVNGINHDLYTTLNQGKTVVLHFFATWDSFSWDYLQSGELQAFNALYSDLGSGITEVWSIESEPSNGLAQLQGPEAMTGVSATQTFGDWITGNNVTIIDNSDVSGLFGLGNLPAVLVICPDALVAIAGEYSSENLYDFMMSECDQLISGSDPALVTANLNRSCGASLADATVVIKNLGTTTLEVLDIQFAGAAGEPVLNWTGSLESYRSDTIEYSGLQLLNDAPVEVKIVSANDNTANDSLSIFPTAALSMMSVQLELALDAYPDEVSWEIRNENDSVIFSDGNFEVAYEYFNLSYVLPQSGCYTFELFDTQGDGLHGSQYGGFDGSCYLRSIDESGNSTAVLYANDGSYNFDSTSESVVFEAGSPLRSEELIVHTTEIFPNPVSDELRLRWQDSNRDLKVIGIFDVSGKHLQEFNCSSDNYTIDCSELKNGLYTLLVNSGGIIWSSRIVVLHH